MAKRIGKCVNIDCSAYKEEIEVEPGADFECPHCHQPLQDVADLKGKGGGKGSKKGLIIGGAAAAVIIIAGIVIAFCLNGSEKPEPKVIPADTTAVKADSAEVKIETDNVKVDSTAQATPIEVPETKTQPTAPTPQNEKTTRSTQSAASSGTINLGYGTYRGDTKNGKPHGYGTITYTRSHKIVSSKEFVANPGDKY